jgi:hypothetical protein
MAVVAERNFTLILGSVQPRDGARVVLRRQSSRAQRAGSTNKQGFHTPLPDFPAGTIVQLNSGGLALQRKLSQHDTRGGIAFALHEAKAAEATGTFTWLGTDDGRYAFVRSNVTQREGQIARDMLRASKRR